VPGIDLGAYIFGQCPYIKPALIRLSLNGEKKVL
jgi:hypothetical protein